MGFDRLITSLTNLNNNQKIALSVISYLICSSIGLLLSDSGFSKPLALGNRNFQYWDTNHYVNLGITFSCQAFYPLWPQIIGHFSQQSTALGFRFSSISSTILFLISLPATLWIFNRIIPDKTIYFLAFLLYVLNPNSIFHANGYTEGIFSFFALFHLGALLFPTSPVSHGLIFSSSVLMALTRPSTIQLSAAAFAALGMVFILGRHYPDSDVPPTLWRRYRTATLLIVLGTLLGYSIYGYYCQTTVGDFFAPFGAQIEWGRKFQLRPLFLFLPRSPLNDLHGLYFPFILMAIAVLISYFKITKIKTIPAYVPSQPWSWLLLFYPPVAIVSYVVCFWRKHTYAPRKLDKISIQETPFLLSDYIFFYSLFICIANTLIGFLAASDSLYSLARFVFAPPFFFIAFGLITATLRHHLLYRFLLGSLLISALGLIHQWYLWGNDRWIG